MTDKFIYYEYDGKNLKVPVEQQKEFESKVPSAKMMLTYKDKNYKVPLSELETFTQKVGADKLTYSAFDDNKEYAPSLSTSKYMSFEEPQFEEEPEKSYASASMADLSIAEEDNSNRIADILRDPNLSRREKRQAKRAARSAGEMPTWGETAAKATGAALATTGKMVVDATNEGGKMGRKRAIANNPLTGIAATIEAITGKSVLDEDNPLNDISENLGETAERWSQEADPTGGEMSFGELLKSGHIGLAMQKGLGSTIESAPMMLATKNPYVAGLYMAGMAASNYADESRENPDIPEWKRAINSVGSAAFELAVEKLIDIPWKYFKNAGGEITEGIVQEVLERAAEEGTQTIAKRIKRIIGNTAKDAVGEGFEEVVTSLGNDALGSALDAIDGNKDYGFKAQWEEFKEQNPDATVDDFANAKGREYVESFLGGALSSVYMSGLANVVKEHQDAGKEREFNKAYVEGASLDYEDMYDTNDDVNAAIDEAVSASVNAKGETTLTREFVENLSAEEALALSRSEDVNPIMQAAFEKLAKLKATQNGLTGKLDDRVASSISRITNVVEQASENGTITCGAYGDKIVFVKGGVVNADGTVSLPNGQNGPVIVIDGGKKYTVDSSEITEAWSTGADGYLQSAESSIRDRDAFLREEYINTVGPRAKAKAVKQYLNTKILINTEEGGMTQVEVQAILPNGEVLVKGKKGDLGGQSERLFGPSAFYDAIARNEDGSPVFVESLSKQQSTQTPADNTQTQAQPQQPATPSEPQDFRDSEQTILINGIPTTVEVTNQDDAADRVTYTYTDENGQEKTGTATVSGFADAIKQAEAETTVEITEDQLSQQNPAGATPDTSDNGDGEIYVKPRKDEEEEASPTATTDTEQIQVEPQNINWDALFENDADAYFAEMQNQFGDKTAKRLGAVVAATQKKLDALNKATPETDNEIFENEEKKEKLEAKIEALNGMIARLSAEPIAETNAAPAAEQVASQEPAPAEPINKPNPTIPEPELVEPAQIEKDPEPRNAVEFAALMLGLKNGIKLTWESFKHHTGYGNGERSKFFGLFRTKENGGMTMEAAGERLMEMDREYDTRFFDQSDPNAGLNAILEALQLNSTMGELRSYTRRQYEADAQREADEYNAYILNAYNEALLEEDVAREDVSQNALTEEQYNELITKFAEEIYDYEESNKRDALAVSEAEEIGDLPLATGETVRGGEGSNSVLQEAQPIQTRGEGTLDEESEGVDERINREDADSPVYSGEPSVSEGVYSESESVSSLDEDIPDFTGESERIPLAPNQVADPIAEAKKIEKHLATQLERDLSKEQKQDLAKSLGKKVADLFATRESYDEYQETATDFGAYNRYFDEGVEDSFAKRQNQQQISNENLSVTSEAQQLVVDALMETLDGYVDTVIATDEQTKEVLALGGIENQFSIETDKPIFISNAALAIHGIKMEKATPEQWLKMIEKAGGLKAGEDKWMGLSDWLKASEKKTLTKHEVLDYINENQIQIEEVHYSANAEENAQNTMSEIERRLKEKFDGYISEYYEEHDIDDIYGSDATDYAIEKLREEMGDTTYPYTIENSGSDVWVVFTYEEVDELQDWANRLGISFTPETPSNSLRLNYTTDGLRNKKEIALVVPTIESWKNYDEVHFGDAGDGRAVVWVRFGDTVGYAPEYAEFYAYQEEMQKKYFPDRATHSLSGNDLISLTPKEKAEFERLRSIKNQIPYSQSRNRKILVIDEIQSKRHQDGREKGYSMTEEEYNRRLEALETEQADRLRRRTNLLRVLKEKYGDDFRVYLKSENTAYVPNRDVMTPEEVKEWNETSQEDIYDAIDALKREKRTGVPAAPFEKNWSELALKRMLRYAAENGYDAIAWTTGNQQSDRYNLAKSFDSIEREDNPNVEGRRFVLSGNNTEGFQVDENGNILGSTIEEARGKTLADVVGKDMADKMMSLENGATIEGEELRIGGEGMKGFYDKMLPAYMNKYGKKWGVKVEDMRLPQVEFGLTMHSVPITEAMKQSVMEGQPMFFKTPNGTVYGWTDGKKIYLTKAGINPNTPIHEYTHIWAKAMMQKNPKGWNRIKQLLKGTPVWNEVVNDPNYSNIKNDEDAVASEVLSRISGSQNAAKMERMAQKMIDEAKGTARKLEARGLIQNMKDALNMFWEFVWKDLFKMTYFRNVEHVTDRVLFDLLNQTDLGELSEGQVETQIVTDPEVIAELEASPKVSGFRNVVQNEDGTFSSPMAYWLQSTKEGAKSRVETAKFELGKWEEAEEHPELVDENGKVTLVKPNKSTVDGVAYDPYIHNRLEPVNLQFKDAWKRDDLVYVETEVAENDLNDGYHADKALLPVGVHSWSNGDVMLSRYDKPVRIMPWEEVADAWAKRLNGEGVHFDVVPPAMRSLLVERGVEILPPHKGMGKDCNDAYAEWKKENEILSRKGENNTKFVEQFKFKQNNEQRELEYSDEFRRLQEESARMSGQLVSEKDGVQQTAIRELVGRIGGTLQRELDRARSGRGYKLRTLVNDSKGTSFDIIENVDGRLFHDIFEIVRTYLPNGELVDLHDNYNDAICYITSDGLAGFAVDTKGNLISVFSLYGNSKKGFLGAIKDLITEAGATHLDGYNSPKQPLAKIYSKVFGWKVASMMDYNMEYDHDNIAENHEVPQVAFMVNTDADIETKHFDKDQYDEAVAYQQEQVEVSNRIDTQNAAVDYLAGPQRNVVIERVVNDEAAKLGVKVTYKTREEMPAGHKNDKGYYNPQTGEIVVCTENATSIADAIKTILHEAVAHKGLRKLFGNRFDEFIRNVYDLLDAETKAKVDARAAAHYNGDTAVAMEEYMASLAENENFADQTIWEKIKSIFTNLINDILGRNDIKIGDNELRYILRASYNNMVNPRSMDTIEGWAKDQLMREEYKVNESTPEILSRTGIDDIAFTTAREAYETVTFNGFTEIMKAIQSATGFKGKVKAIKTGLLKIWNEVQMENQDAQQAVIAGIEAIQKETGNIPVEDFENYLMAENQSQSRSAEEIESFLQNYFAPIVDHINTIITAVMKARGLNPKNKKKRAEIYAEVRNYMIAKHGLERNAYYQTTTGDMRDYSGLTALFGLPDTEFALAETLAQDMVDKFENEIGDAARDALWDKINAATNKTLRHSYECGLLSRSQYDKIKDMFDFYIPLRGFDETTAEDVYSYARFDGNRFQPVVREAHGRTSLAFDPISVIMNMAQSEIVQGNKNRVKQALYNFVGNRPNSLLTRRDCWYVLNRATGVWEEAYPDIANGETWDNFETRMQALEATGDAQKMKKGLDIGYRFQKPANKDEHYIHLKINGVEHAIYVNGNQRLAEGVNGFNRNTPNILDSIKKVNRAASQLFTNYSYKFGGKNFLRDFIWAQTVMRIKESPLYRLRFAGNWMANNPITIGVLMKKYRNGTLDMSNNNHRLFKEFIENGGKTGYVFIDELEKQKSRIDKAIERMAKNGNTKTNNATKAALLLNIIQYVNECIELAARFGTYVTSRNTKDKSGNVRSITKSIDDAKGITTNFNRKGAQSGRGLIGGLANFMGSWNFFYNAAVQGVQQIKKLNDEHPIKAKVVIGGWIGLGFALPFILDIFRGDDDDDEIYWNIPEYERKNNICIPLGKGKVTLTIPLSPTIREAYAIGVTINDAIFNKSVDKDATMLSMECASLLAKALIPANPVEGLSAGLTPAENLIMFGTPDIADPIVESVINKDWTGSPIEYRTTYNEGAPHYTKVVGKNDWKERVGEKLYKMGENNLDSSLDLPLSAWEHVITSSTGGIGTIMKDISNIAEWVMGTETPERLNDIPVARTLFSSSAMDDEKFVNNIYWDMNDVYKKKTKTLSSVYGLTEKEAFAEQEGKGESNLVKVYEAKSYPFLKRYYELNKELSTMQKNIDKMPTETQSDKNEKVLAGQELFNKKRDMVYELLEYEIE